VKANLICSVFFVTAALTSCRDSKPEQAYTKLAAPLPAATPKQVPIPPGAVEEGRKIFERIRSNYARAEISIWGAASNSPKVALWIPESEWKSLSSIEQGYLGYYVKSSVPAIRSNPGPHTGISSSAPIYSRLVSNCYNMSNDSWIIGVGPYNAEGKLLLDHEAVNGTESPWRANEPLVAPLQAKLLPTTDPATTMSTWTSSDGRTIQAKMLRLEGENVILQRNDGGIFKVPLVNLSSESQAAAKSR
jgi:hypothetical protein